MIRAMSRAILPILTLATAAAVFPALPTAAEVLAGPVQASVTRVIDGDTLEVEAHLWPGLALTENVRIRGIDAPELHSECAAERVMAAAARDRLVAIAGGSISLRHIANDKYGGRVDADVANAAGADLRATLLAAGLVRAYDGGARGDWCPVGSIGRSE
jgi:endonuclease YncB( thermonuclease family)